jgi:hypothetical protein
MFQFPFHRDREETIPDGISTPNDSKLALTAELLLKQRGGGEDARARFSEAAQECEIFKLAHDNWRDL